MMQTAGYRGFLAWAISTAYGFKIIELSEDIISRIGILLTLPQLRSCSLSSNFNFLSFSSTPPILLLPPPLPDGLRDTVVAEQLCTKDHKGPHIKGKAPKVTSRVVLRNLPPPPSYTEGEDTAGLQATSPSSSLLLFPYFFFFVLLSHSLFSYSLFHSCRDISNC